MWKLQVQRISNASSKNQKGRFGHAKTTVNSLKIERRRKRAKYSSQIQKSPK
jgi:hypothetical protein